MQEIDEIVETLTPRWRKHIAGLRHVTWNTAATFVRLSMPDESFAVRSAVAEGLFDVYCDDLQCARHESDIAVQLFSEDI